MDSFNLDLSDNCSDFSTSLYNNSEMEIYNNSSEINNKNIKSYVAVSNSDNKFQLLQTGNHPDNNGINTVESSSTLFDLSVPTFSVNRLSFTSEIKDLQQILSDINEQYAKWKTSMFLLEFLKFEINARQNEEKETWRKITVSSPHPIKYFKSKSGQTFNFLGLDDSLLHPNEKSELHKHVIADIEKNVKKLIDQKKMFSDLLGSHGLKIYTAESLLSEEQEQLAQLYKYIDARLDQACQLVYNNNLIMQHLVYFTSSPMCELMKTSYTSLKDKASHLHNTTSILKFKVEQRLYQDKEQTKVWNDHGDNLRLTIKELNGQLKSLQKALHEYERKEETSKTYKEIVANFSRTQRQLQHKIQTLNVLNNPDISF